MDISNKFRLELLE